MHLASNEAMETAACLEFTIAVVLAVDVCIVTAVVAATAIIVRTATD